MLDAEQLRKYFQIRFDSLSFTLIFSLVLWFSINAVFIDYKIADGLGLLLSITLFVLIIIIIALCIFRYFYFFYTTKPSNDKIRILVGIHSENEKQKLRLKEDFINKIQDLSQTQDSAFEILELKESYIDKIKRSNNKAKYIKKINKKIKGHLYIYGKITERGNRGVKTYILNPRYMLFHREVDKGRKKRLQLNMDSVWTKSQFAVDNEVEGFEITSNTIYFIIRYFIGISAVFSDLILVGYNMHKPLLEDLDKAKDLPNKLFIKNELHNVLDEEISALSSYYLSKQNYKKFFDINKILPKIGRKDLFFLREAIYFYKKGDINKAFESIKKSMKRNDKKGINAWRYSLSYLCLVSRDYKKFLKHNKLSESTYQRLKDRGLHKDFILHFFSEMIKFAVIDYKDTKNPDLLFWIGYLNFYFLENIPEAFSYFEKIDKKHGDYFNHKHHLYDEYENYYNKCKKIVLGKQ